MRRLDYSVNYLNKLFNTVDYNCLFPKTLLKTYYYELDFHLVI